MVLAMIGRWDQCCLLFWPVFFLLIAGSGAKILPRFSFVSGYRLLHDQGRLREGIRILRADILPKCFASSISVHRSSVCYHKCRLCETRKSDDRLSLRWERPLIDLSCQPICGFIFAKNANLQFIEGNMNGVYYRNEVESSWCSMFLEKALFSCRIVSPALQPNHAWGTCNWRKF